MDEERRSGDDRRKACNENSDEMRRQLQAVHDKVFNGFPAEIRKEVAQEVRELDVRLDKLRSLFVGILVSALLLLIGSIISNSFMSSKRGAENDRNFAKMERIEEKLDMHIREWDRYLNRSYYGK